MEYTGWGLYPTMDATLYRPRDLKALKETLLTNKGIARGLGRSYGDSALASTILSSSGFSHMLSFDDSTGLLTVEAGVSLKSIIDAFLPRGWFLGVVPGTQYVTVGGAIASDIHGKNHHIAGCFSQFVTDITVMTADGTLQTCTTNNNAPLFHATCGGMGLTGFITQATLQLIRVPSSRITQTRYACANLKETLQAFSECDQHTYSVAWIDSASQGQHFGRSIILLGEHSDGGDYTEARTHQKNVPCFAPSWVLNAYSIRAFNTLYYHKNKRGAAQSELALRDYFFPLDHITHWNRLYGKPGFLQYQCAFPMETSREGIQAVLKHLQSAGLASFLSVLKKMGPANNNLLSFPFEGFSLALDIKNTPQAQEALLTCDQIVLRLGGRLYLTKDARMGAEFFHQSYHNASAFYQFRQSSNAITRFASLQSTRLEI